jgi:hypothetical protein
MASADSLRCAGDLPRREAAAIYYAEIRCCVAFQASDSCTRLPRCTDFPRYLDPVIGLFDPDGLMPHPRTR